METKSHKKVIESELSLRSLPSKQEGTQFFCYELKAKGSTPKHWIYFLHGAVCYAGRHRDFFDWIIEKSQGSMGIQYMDIVGHGTSAGARAYVDNFNIYVEDFFTWMNATQEVRKDASYSFVSHSMGGLILLKAILEHEQRFTDRPTGAVFSAPCIRPKPIVDWSKTETILKGLSENLPYVRLPSLYSGDELCNDPVAANAFETDQLVSHFMTTRLAYEIWQASRAVRSLSYFLKWPCLFLIPEQDVLVDSFATELFCRGVEKKWITVRKFENGKHELMHDKNKVEKFEDIYQWTLKCKK